ncbi:SH3 domain-containing protein [Clostridium perfringens]|uniref:SH3 domain-containing protein n=1 Tax=Clostridium perfringens TaxID=1502 RepID=UPI001240A92C|nr:SH3 domain-containing protein [Clostridium perfringens]
MKCKKFLLSFALCLVILSGFSISASARTINNTVVGPTLSYGGVDGRVNTSGGRLNVRSGPGTNYSIIGSLGPLEPVKLIGSNSYGDWIYVKYNLDGTNDQKVGWAYGDYILNLNDA